MSPALATGFFTTRTTWEAQPIYGFIFFTLFHEKKSKNDAAVHGVTKSWTWLRDWKQQHLFFRTDSFLFRFLSCKWTFNLYNLKYLILYILPSLLYFTCIIHKIFNLMLFLFTRNEVKQILVNSSNGTKQHGMKCQMNLLFFSQHFPALIVGPKFVSFHLVIIFANANVINIHVFVSFNIYNTCFYYSTSWICFHTSPYISFMCAQSLIVSDSLRYHGL